MLDGASDISFQIRNIKTQLEGMEKYFSIKTYFGYLSRSFQVRLYWMFACCQAKVYSKYLSNSLEMKAKYLLLFIF